jgi:hypothetical protein
MGEKGSIGLPSCEIARNRPDGQGVRPFEETVNKEPKATARTTEREEVSLFTACSAAVLELSRAHTVAAPTRDRLLAACLLAERLEPSSDRPYGRRVLFQDGQGGEVMLATWHGHARTAPHEHGGAHGLVFVLFGTFEEREHTREGNGLGAVCSSRTWREGDAIVVAPETVHDMTSQAKGVTLHVYAGALAPFSLYDLARRETVRATGGAWFPADSVISRDAWEGPRK